MRRPQGHAQIFGPSLDGPHDDPGVASLHRDGECDTFTCGHCQKIVLVPSQAQPTTVGGLCRVCNSFVCQSCANDRECKPFQEQLERALALDARRKALRGLL